MLLHIALSYLYANIRCNHCEHALIHRYPNTLVIRRNIYDDIKTIIILYRDLYIFIFFVVLLFRNLPANKKETLKYKLNIVGLITIL